MMQVPSLHFKKSSGRTFRLARPCFAKSRYPTPTVYHTFWNSLNISLWPTYWSASVSSQGMACKTALGTISDDSCCWNPQPVKSCSIPLFIAKWISHDKSPKLAQYLSTTISCWKYTSLIQLAQPLPCSSSLTFFYSYTCIYIYICVCVYIYLYISIYILYVCYMCMYIYVCV